eukprot:g684.t1
MNTALPMRLNTNKPVCVVGSWSKKHGLFDKDKCIACYDEVLCAGTLVHGIDFECKGKRFFAVTDILEYCGTMVDSYEYATHVKYLAGFFTHVAPVPYRNDFVMFGVPLVDSDYKSLAKAIAGLPYAVV